LPQTTKPKNATGKSWFVILFALPFAAIGVGFLVLSVIPTLFDWTRMHGWQPVQAVLTQADLESHSSDDSTTYSVSATYHYSFAGLDYQSSRVAIGETADNIGSFQEDLGRRLERALRAEAPVQIWVNPSNPAEAVIDRGLRPGLLAFKMIFVVTFGGVGVGLLVYQFTYTGSATFIDGANDTRPWLQNAAWANNRIGSNQRTGIWFVWCFALLWNLISAPILLVLPGELGKGNYMALLGLLFTLVGVFLLRWAAKLTRDWQRFGELYLSLDPFPGAIGGQVGGTIELGLPYSPQHRFQVILDCVYVYEIGSGEDSSTREKSLWQSDGIASAQACNKGTRIQFRFDVPQNLPASQPAKMPYHCWRLDLKSAAPDLQKAINPQLATSPQLSRQFEIPVFNTKETSRYIDRDSAAHPDVIDARLELVEKVCQFAQVNGGVELEFPVLRHWKNSFMGLCLGSIFAGAGVAMGFADAPLIFPVLFTGLGGLVAWVCLYALGNSFTVILDGQGLQLRNFFCGIAIGNNNIGREKLVKLKLKESYSTNAGRSQKTVYKILLETKTGKSFKVADSLEGSAAAQYLLENISLYSGIPTA
jgi:hypothetical protein